MYKKIIVASTIILNSPMLFASDFNALLEEVVVTATKKSTAENLQDIPIAATAYSSEQLDSLHLHDLKDLTYSMPNVAMEEIGTYKGVANFSFRGLGVNSSVPTVEPTVGVFVDGVYLGNNYGVVLDQFDLEGIEVLRGPQGVLFGRNVTGGAVIIKTTDPTEETSGSIRTSVETGLNKYLMGTLSGSLIENKLLGKIAVYRNDDEGYFTNTFNGDDHYGGSKTDVVRGALTYLVSDDIELKFKYEHGETESDGAIAQNNAVFERGHTFDIKTDLTDGFNNITWDFSSTTLTWNVGAGVITNIIGWRDVENESMVDIDGTEDLGYHARDTLLAEQFSEELRYNITLNENLDVTVGAYYFTQDVDYVQNRVLAFGAVDLAGGGSQEQSTVGIFANADWRVNEEITFNLGLRYTTEKKEIEVATFTAGSTCNVSSAKCEAYDFVDEEKWGNLTPKVGVQWFFSENAQVYASYSKGFRSGGYNLRNTSPTASPGPFDEEEQDSFELGLKLDAFDSKLRINAAVFHNEVKGMQREVAIPDATSGTIQTIQNTADATITGAEIELIAKLSENILLMANAGYLDDEYNKVKFDLNGDGDVNAEDKKLSLPRLAPLTSGVSLIWQNDVFDGQRISVRLAYSHRDKAYSTDNNLGILDSIDRVDVDVTFTTQDEKLSVSVYGKNLTDESSYGFDTPLPALSFLGYTGGKTPSFTTLNKGRILGVGLSYKF